MERHCTNARAVAEFLSKHDAVERVHFPGLASHPDHDVARRQQSDFGAVVSLELRGGEAAARRFLRALRLFTLAESLGGVASLVCHPPTMTHASVEPEVRRQRGITDGLLRLSIGCEDPRDLLEDLARALEAVDVPLHVKAM
jgi:cystathionine gamma-synthase